MDLYSYKYINDSFSATSNLYWLVIGFSIIVMLAVGVFYYRHKDNPRLRNLLVVIAFIGALMIALQFNRLAQQRNTTSQTSQVTSIMKMLSKKDHVSLNKIYASSSAPSDGMTIQAGKTSYVVHFNNDQSNYTLSKAHLAKAPTHVDKQKFNFSNINGNNNGVNFTSVFLKFVVGMIIVVMQINLSGKGNLAPTNAVDQLQNYILGGIIGGTIYNSQITLLQFIIILLIWAVIVFTLKYLTSQSNLMNKFFNGSPQILILNGKINVKRCLDNGISANDLAFKLRTHGVTDLEAIKNATLEQNGQLTITTIKDNTFNYALIADGEINVDVMKRLKLDFKDVEALVHTQNTIIPNVYLGQYQNGKLEIVPYPYNAKKHLPDFIKKL